MTTASHGERQAIFACEAHGRRDVGRIYRVHNQRRMLIYLGRIAFAKLLVFWIAGAVHRS
jgi:hypothetical protein